MHYFASLNTVTFVCNGIMQVEDEVYDANVANGYSYENAYSIAIESYDESLIYRKKYINGEWVDALPSESGLPKDTEMLHIYGTDDKFLSEALGELATLSTEDKTSLVDAVNECFQYANDGKTVISNAIIGVDSSLTIPENVTFAQLATLISQISTGMKVKTGSLSEISAPTTIAGTTDFQPKLVAIYNVGTGVTNVNIGLYISSSLIGSQISDSVYGLGGTLTRYANPFTITDAGFTFVNKGSATNLKWIALG